MIELNVIAKNFKIDTIFINKINNVIVENYQTMYEMLSTFFDINNSETIIEIGNKKLDNKRAQVINLLDFESIFYQMSFKKGSIMYEYLLTEINIKLEDLCSEINLFLEEIFKPIIDSSIIDYTLNFEVDSVKLASNFGVFKNNVNLKKYLEILKKLLEDLITNNPRKTFIIFTNDKLINDAIDDLENVFIFKFNGNGPYNIFIDKDVLNFDYELIINHYKLSWPTDISRHDLRGILNRYISEYHQNSITEIYDVEMYVAAILFNQVMNIHKSVSFCGNFNKIENSYIEFIKRLK